MEKSFEQCFPNLENVHQKKTSEQDQRYNCIAWAFKDNRRFWWPSSRAFWPLDIDQLSELEAFEQWFEHDGWEETQLPTLEPNFEKVALFTKEGKPTHAARLLESGYWSSKLGGDIDISHTLNELDGPLYGSVLRIYRKPIQDT
tara:strand:- start:668 stop:1099 length:432 start_codon:yes stop_codon:yes gene_type:complete